jgi:hypothetical protein
MAQLQCPHCKGYKIGTPISKPNPSSRLCGIFFSFWRTPHLRWTATTIGGWVILGSFGAYGGLFMCFSGSMAGKDEHEYFRTHHECLICGKRWETPD